MYYIYLQYILLFYIQKVIHLTVINSVAFNSHNLSCGRRDFTDIKSPAGYHYIYNKAIQVTSS